MSVLITAGYPELRRGDPATLTLVNSAGCPLPDNRSKIGVSQQRRTNVVLPVVRSAPDQCRAPLGRQRERIGKAYRVRIDNQVLQSMRDTDGSRTPSLYQGRPCNRDRSRCQPDWSAPVRIYGGVREQ